MVLKITGVIGIWELLSIMTAAEALEEDDIKTQIRGSRTEHEGILTDRNQTKKSPQCKERANNQVTSDMEGKPNENNFQKSC